MSYSNSSLNCFADCMRKYEHAYIKHTEPCRPPSPHLVFGAMAHEVLEKAGRLRDDVDDGVVEKGEYYDVIPSEALYPELKREFNITSWEKYFRAVIKETAAIERDLSNTLLETGALLKERELTVTLSIDELKYYGIGNFTDGFKGVIDLLLYTSSHAIIIDYKFSNNRKTQQNFDMDSQLQLYALMVHLKYDIPLHNIQYGYIDIPKQMFDNPVILKNGTLSRAKSQNVDAELYKAAVEAIHGDDAVYNCDKGGYYYECYCELKRNKAAYLNIRHVDEEAYAGVLTDLIDTAKFIEVMKKEQLPFLAKYNSYSCGNCEYVNACKPWLTIGGNNE